MPDRLQEVREIVTRDYEEMRSLVSRLGDDTLGRKTSNGWTVAQLAGHIAMSPEGDIFVLDRLRKGSSASLPGPLSFLIDVMNWRGVRKFKAASKQALLEAMEKAHTKRMTHLNGLTDADLDKGGEVLRMGKMTAYEYMKRSGDHGREHAADLRKTIGL